MNDRQVRGKVLEEAVSVGLFFAINRDTRAVRVRRSIGGGYMMWLS